MSPDTLPAAQAAFVGLAGQPLRLLLAVALVGLPIRVALAAVRRGPGQGEAGRYAAASWRLGAALIVGMSWCAASLCLLAALHGWPNTAPGTGPAFAALGLCGVAAFAWLTVATSRAASTWLAGLSFAALALCAGFMLWVHALDEQLPMPAGYAAVALAAAGLFAAVALQAALAVTWARGRWPTTMAATLAISAVSGLAFLPGWAAIGLWWPQRGAPTSMLPGFEGFVGLLALIGLGLALSAVQREQRLLGRQDRLSEKLNKATASLERTSYADVLTGLPNRAGLDAQLRSLVARIEGKNTGLALLKIGLDGFSAVNESFGISQGDIVLREMATRLLAAGEELARRRNVRAPMLYRTGGDKFVLLVQGEVERRALGPWAVRLLEAIAEPVALERTALTMSASIGIACFPDDGAAGTLLTHAGAAMRAAKESGGSTHAYFEARVQDDARERLELLADLRRAVESKQLELYYQPKIDARSGQVTAAEALLRWHHPTRGMISPAIFIPIAERYGLISALGNWTIEDACRQARKWREAGLKMRVAINLSVYQMRQDDLVERIQSALKRHRIEPSRLTCEITESVAMEDTQVTQRTFERLGAAGIHLSIDDFGTGYSSLAYLRKLPASELKIDRSFVMDLSSSADARAIVDAVMKLAHAIGLKVVAEGVETEQQRDILLALGCDEFQGFLFARPMSARALLLWAIDDKPMKASFRASLFSETQAKDHEATRPAELAAPSIDRISIH